MLVKHGIWEAGADNGSHLTNEAILQDVKNCRRKSLNKTCMMWMEERPLPGLEREQINIYLYI
jgi:hypothetical protein